MKSRRYYLSIPVLIAAMSLGCGRSGGPELAEVTGVITLDGEPLSGLNVVFVPEDGGSPSYGGTDDSGEYRLVFSRNRAGAMLGRHRVQLEVRPPEFDELGKLVDPIDPVRLPVKYKQPAALIAEVESGQNTIDFDLDSQQ